MLSISWPIASSSVYLTSWMATDGGKRDTEFRPIHSTDIDRGNCMCSSSDTVNITASNECVTRVCEPLHVERSQEDFGETSNLVLNSSQKGFLQMQATFHHSFQGDTWWVAQIVSGKIYSGVFSRRTVARTNYTRRRPTVFVAGWVPLRVSHVVRQTTPKYDGVFFSIPRHFFLIHFNPFFNISALFVVFNFNSQKSYSPFSFSFFSSQISNDLLHWICFKPSVHCWVSRTHLFKQLLSLLRPTLSLLPLDGRPNCCWEKDCCVLCFRCRSCSHPPLGKDENGQPNYGAVSTFFHQSSSNRSKVKNVRKRTCTLEPGCPPSFKEVQVVSRWSGGC